VLAQGAGRLIRRRTDRGVVAVFDSRLANRQYKTHLLAAMPPLRRSVDLEQACAFLEEAAGGSPQTGLAALMAAPALPVEREPGDVRDDISMNESVEIRNVTTCPVCHADLTERCVGPNGTLAFLHHARIREVPI
jgi:hypothetical protein